MPSAGPAREEREGPGGSSRHGCSEFLNSVLCNAGRGHGEAASGWLPGGRAHAALARSRGAGPFPAACHLLWLRISGGAAQGVCNAADGRDAARPAMEVFAADLRHRHSLATSLRSACEHWFIARQGGAALPAGPSNTPSLYRTMYTSLSHIMLGPAKI